MKRFCLFLFSFILVISLLVPAFAAEGEGESSSELDSEPEVITEVVVPDVIVENEIFAYEDMGEYVGTSVYSLNPITPNDSNGLKAVVLRFLGDWDSIVVEHQYQTTNGNYNYVREIQLDYPWLCSAAILAIMIFCLFRLGGAILCKT